MSTTLTKVGIIGAGAAGLSAVRHLAPLGHKVLPVVFELSDVVGGTWVFNPKTGSDKHGNPIHSSMYERLYTNLPREVMAFPDLPIQSDVDWSTRSSFLHHTEVRKYLDDYCSHFNLSKFIKFETKVELVEPVTDKASSGFVPWRVKWRNLNSGETEEDQFDYVIVCNGHYSVPKFPNIPGLEKFQGQIIHSHDYRNPLPFKGQRVAILGAAASGMDICLEVASEAVQVYLCHNKPPLVSRLPSNLVQTPGIVECITAYGFLLSDGSKLQADVLLLCTGYEFSFPFLAQECGVTTGNQCVKPLYKHVIHTKFPSLMFIGIPMKVCPFPQFDLQAQWCQKIITREVSLPSEEAMNRDTDEEMKRKIEAGVAPRHFHVMGEKQWIYNREIAALAGVPEIPKAVQTLYDDVHERRMKSLMTYKKESFKMGEDGLYHLREK